MFRKHSKVISVILSLTLIATMCVMSATSFSAADTGFYVVGEMQGWAPATADPMTDNGDGSIKFAHGQRFIQTCRLERVASR